MHHLLYTFSIICNFVVMSIYWSILHREQVRIHYNDPGVGHGRVIHLCLVHSLPGITCLVNSYITNCRLKQGFWKLVCVFLIVYGAFVYTFWKITGRIQYPFIDFNKSQIIAFRNMGAIGLFACAFYLIFFQIDHNLKINRSLKE